MDIEIRSKEHVYLMLYNYTQLLQILYAFPQLRAAGERARRY